MDPTQIMQHGNEAFSRGNYGEALRYYKQALEGVREDPNPLADLYGNIGNVYGISGKINEAVAWYQKAITILRRLEDYGRLGVTYVNVGNLYLDQGDAEKSLNFYKQGVLLLEQAEKWDALCVLYGNISRLYLQQSQHQTALEYAEKGMVLATRLNQLPLLAGAFHRLAKTKGGMGNIESACELSESAYTLYRQIPDELGCASARYDQALLYEKAENLEAAIACLKEVVAIDEKYRLPKLKKNTLWLKKLQAKKKLTFDNKRSKHDPPESSDV